MVGRRVRIMLNRKKSSHPDTYQMELTNIDLLVPQDHLLRLIDKHVDFSFITEKVRPYYSETQGRPSLDPIMLFKMMLIGYLYGIRSERQLEQEIIPHAAYRWFLGLSLSDRVPDHSTISWNRNNRFKGTTVFQEIFDEIVRLAIEHQMVGGRILMTDSTHVQADANKYNYTVQVVTDTPQTYVEELEKAVNADREAHGKKPLPPKEEEAATKENKVSNTDPQSGYMVRDGKPEGFFYLDHRTVDPRFNIITDVFMTPGNVNDSVVYIERLKRQIETFGFAKTLEAVALDSGYMTPYICEQTCRMKLFAAIAERKAPTAAGIQPKSEFTYNSETNTYVCPQGEQLTYATTNRAGYREYKSDPARCSACPLLGQCTNNANQQRVIQRHVWEDSKEQVAQYRNSATGKALMRLRSHTIERSFADAKVLHGYRRCRMRGREKAQEQALLTGAAQNLIKIARYLAQKAKNGHAGGQTSLFLGIFWIYPKTPSLLSA